MISADSNRRTMRRCRPPRRDDASRHGRMKTRVDMAFARDAGLMVVSNGLAGFLFMCVHMIAGRWMRPADYAALVSLLGLLWIVNVPSAALQVAVARYASEYCHVNAQDLWARLFWSVIRVVSVAAIVGLAVWAALSPFLRTALQAASVPSLLWIGGIAAVSLFTPVVNGALQGARRFGWLAAAGLAPGIVRIGLAVAVCLAGGGVSAMLAVYVASVLAGLVTGAIPILRERSTTPSIRLDLRPFASFFWPVAAGQALLYVLMNADLILMSRLLEGPVFSAYGKASMLARSVLFLPMPVILAMFPRAVVSDRLSTLLAPLGVAMGLAIGLACGVTLFPGLALRLMYGVEGAAVERLLVAYVWAAVPLAMSMALSHYVWARRGAKALLWLAPAAVVYSGALVLCGAGDPLGMIGWMAMGNSAALVLLLLIVHRLFARRPA